jgi:hypothetical protein
MLVAILLPSLAKARQAVRRVSCASQVRQLFLCDSLYATDSKGWGIYNVYESQPHYWHNVPDWSPYFPNYEKLLVCPGMASGLVDTRVPGKMYGTDVWATYFCLFATGQNPTAVNTGIVGGWHAYTTTSTTERRILNASPNQDWMGQYIISQGGVKHAWYGQPYEQVAFTDAFGGTDNNSLWVSSWLGKVAYPDVLKPNNHAQSQGENIGYMDGHVRWRNETEVTNKYTYGKVYW